MTLTLRIIGAAAALAALSACVEDSGAPPAAPGLAEQSCLRDVARTTNNPEVAILGSTFSEAGTEVIVGVGPDLARWRCIGYADGTTAGIMSLTDEGAL